MGRKYEAWFASEYRDLIDLDMKKTREYIAGCAQPILQGYVITFRVVLLFKH